MRGGDAAGLTLATTNVPDHLLAHLPPLGWQHINPTVD
jgi:hypothetical protein